MPYFEVIRLDDSLPMEVLIIQYIFRFVETL